MTPQPSQLRAGWRMLCPGCGRVIWAGQRVAFVRLRLGLGHGAACGWTGDYRAHPDCARLLEQARAETTPLPRSKHDEVRARGYRLARALGAQEPRARTRVNRPAFERTQQAERKQGTRQ